MAHFAKLDDNNVVINVEVVADKDCLDSSGNESESVGEAFLQTVHGVTNTFKQTSYNTFGGKHYVDGGALSENQSKAFRKNYATIGGTYDASRDAFIQIKPYESWVLDETTCLYKSSITEPNVKTYTDGNGDQSKYDIFWDEDNIRWLATDRETPQNDYAWDSSNLRWISI
tara:strand:- start:87 stop:599 length:513 start_codon:yes stop_codon:yes gene_type:complete